MQKQAEEQRKREEKMAEEQRKSAMNTEQNQLVMFLMEQQRRLEEERKIEKEEQRIREEKQAEEQRKLYELLLAKSDKDEGDDLYDKIEKMIDQKMSNVKNLDQSQNHHTNNNGTYFEAKHQNNLLNNLNLNYNNVISMNQFLYNMEHVNKIPKSDLEAIAFAQKNLSDADLAETIHKTIEKNVIEQTKGVINPADGLELLPVFPVVCSDGNCRSHKEKVNEFWETVYGDRHFDKMLNIIDKRLYEVLQKKIYLEDYGKKKLFKKMKRKNTIHDMKSMQEKVNGEILGKKFKEI